MNKKEELENKIMPNTETALSIISAWKKNNEKIVFTNGCFDLFHAGHALSLADSADFGTKLIVGLNDDNSIKKIKGHSRPFIEYQYRAKVVASLSSVDLVIPFSEDTPEKLIHAIIPNVLAKGNDYSLETIIGASFILENNGEIAIIPLTIGLSSTQLANNIFEKMK